MQIMQEQLSVTLLVMRSYLVLPGASRARVAFRDPTAFLGSTSQIAPGVRHSASVAQKLTTSILASSTAAGH